MSLYKLRPIGDRTPFTGKHIYAPFRATWSTTRGQLAVELRALSARNVVLELDYHERDIRVDGELRADARCQSPAARLSFESKHGPLTYATDRFSDWNDNVRAIVLSLESLRRVDRYGITRRGEQYTGWKQLPTGTGMGETHMSRETAIQVIKTESAFTVFEGEWERAAIRAARANTHPDRSNGDRSRWDAVEQATRVLQRSSS